MDLFLRIAILAVLLLAGSLCFAGGGYLARLWMRPAEIRISPFTIAGGVDKSAIPAIAKILREDLNDISDASSWNPERSRVSGPSLPEGALGRRLPLGSIATESALKFKISDFEVIGFVDRVVQLFRLGPRLAGTIVSAGDRWSMAVEYSDSGSGERVWFSTPQPDLRSTVREMAYQIVWDLHRQNSPELQDLELPEFRALVDARKALQRYSTLSASADKTALESILKSAAALLQPHVKAGTRSVWFYKYLGAIHLLLEDQRTAAGDFEQAAKLAPGDPFVEQHLRAIHAAAAAPKTLQFGPLLAQPAFRPLSIEQAQARVGAGKRAVVAQLDTGLQRALFPPDRVVDGFSVIPGASGWEDDFGHGTAAASLIVAISPAASLLPIKVLSNTGSGDDSGILKGLNYAAEHAKVVMLGFGSQDPPRPKYAAAILAIVGRGGIVVAPAGNEPGTARTNPAGLDEVISVASVDEAGKLAPFTTYGSWVTVAAPGVNIETYGLGGVRERLSGGTFSTAIVTAVVSMMAAVNPDLTAAKAKEILIRTSTPLKGPNAGKLAGGIVHAAAAVEVASLR